MKLRSGQRVLYLTRPASRGHMAHIFADVYLSLENPVSGRVLRVVDGRIDFRPDGWPLPAGLWPGGFSTVANRLREYPVESDKPGPVCNGLAQPYTRREVLGKLLSYLPTASQSIFETISREDAIKAVENEFRGLEQDDSTKE